MPQPHRRTSVEAEDRQVVGHCSVVQWSINFEKLDMQSERTIQFWDDFYRAQQGGYCKPEVQQLTATHGQNPGKTCDKEWILQPSSVLLDQLAHHLLNDNNRAKSPLRILEIGCGTSCLARELWLYLTGQQDPQDVGQPDELMDKNKVDWKHQGQHPHPMSTKVHMLATDVSKVCIEQIRERDAALLQQKSDDTRGSLEYGILNVAEQHPELRGKFDVILDKGCLDTFLFRSKQRGAGQPYAPLVRKVLDNLHSWLADGDDSGDGGVYLIMSPRPKLKSARDYRGFCNFRRNQLDLDRFRRGELEGKDERIFLYTCRKNPSYSALCTDAFGIEKPRILDSDICKGCQVSFFDFRNGEPMEGRGETFWFRGWRGHCQHCKG